MNLTKTISLLFLLMIFSILASCSNSSDSNPDTLEKSGYDEVSLSPPQNVKATKSEYLNAVKLSWSKVNGASGYRVYRLDTEVSSFKEISKILNDTSYCDSNTVINKEYFYKVKAFNHRSESEFSETSQGHTESNEMNWRFYQVVTDSLKKGMVKMQRTDGFPYLIKGDIGGEYYERYSDTPGNIVREAVFDSYNDDGHILNGILYVTHKFNGELYLSGTLSVTGGIDDGEIEPNLYSDSYLQYGGDRFSNNIAIFYYNKGYVNLKAKEAENFSKCEAKSYLLDIGENGDNNWLPIAQINSPEKNVSFSEGDFVSFAGNGTDNEDGDLPEDALIWSSDLDGQIGTGASFSTSMLSPGEHTITLTVTDKDNARATESIKLTIISNL